MGLLEAQSEAGHIDLYYGDETVVSQEGYVPYGWQFDDEDVAITCSRGKKMNYFGILTRQNDFRYKAAQGNINADFIIRFMDEFSLTISKPTVVVLDNAKAHTAKKVMACLKLWQSRGMFIFLLPPYSPQLNIIERFWKEVKEGQLKPEDYKETDALFYAVNRIFEAVGKEWKVNFSKYNQNYN